MHIFIPSISSIGRCMHSAAGSWQLLCSPTPEAEWMQAMKLFEAATATDSALSRWDQDLSQPYVDTTSSPVETKPTALPPELAPLGFMTIFRQSLITGRRQTVLFVSRGVCRFGARRVSEGVESSEVGGRRSWTKSGTQRCG